MQGINPELLYGPVLLVGLYVGARGVAAVLGGLGATPQTVILVRYGGCIAAILGATVATGPVTGLLYTATPLAGRLAATAVASGVVMSGLALSAVAAVSRGFYPVTVDASDRWAPAPRSYWLFVWGLLLVFSVQFQLGLYDVTPLGTDWLLPAAGVLILGRHLGQNVLAPRSTGLFREATEAERQRVADCYDRFGRTPPTTLVAPIPEAFADVVVFGVGRHTWLFVDEAILTELSETELAVALAQADETHRQRHRLLYVTLQMGAVVVLGTLLIGVLFHREAVATLAALLVASVVLVLAAVPLVRAARRRVFAADRFAAEALGLETVTDVYDRHGERISTIRLPTLPPPVIAQFCVPIPSIAERRRRLHIT